MNINSENRFSGVFPSLNPNSEIQYYIQCNANNGDQISHPNFGWHTFNSLSNSLTIEENNKLKPTAWALHQNYPNPFNPITVIRYDLPQDAFVKITVFNIYGKIIKTIINEKKVLVQNLFIGMLPIIKENLFHQEFIFTELK